MIINEKTKQMYLDNMLRNLPVLRAKLGTTQKELADRLGVTRQTITALESGKRTLTWTNYLAMCFVFDNCEETRMMIDLYDICPEIVRHYLRNK